MLRKISTVFHFILLIFHFVNSEKNDNFSKISSSEKQIEWIATSTNLYETEVYDTTTENKLIDHTKELPENDVTTTEILTNITEETTTGEDTLLELTTNNSNKDELTTSKITDTTLVENIKETTTTFEETTYEQIESTTKEPFYKKTIHQLVKAVESNILDEVLGSSVEVSTHAPAILPETNVTDQRLDSLSHQIRAIIRHYQQYGEVTAPNSDIPDPMDIPDVKRNFGGSPTTFTTMKMYGLSNFTISHINTDLNKMQVYVLLLMKRLIIIGNYSVKSWLVKKAGPFNVTLLDVEAGGAAELKRDENGTFQATDSELDMTFRDAVVDFKNLGMVGSILQGLLASAAPVLFEAIKPVVLKEINTRIREDLNVKLEKIGRRMAVTGSRPPLDVAEEEGRKYVIENGYDPLHVKDFSIKQNIFAINITKFSINGLSNFHRVGELVLTLDEGSIQIGVHIAALNLTGRCKWGVRVGQAFSKQGYTNFTVDHIQVRAFVNQSLDIKTKPILDKLDINLGKVRVNMDGAGRFDIVVEVMVNTLPDLIRHIIVDAIEEPLKSKIQQILNRIEPEIAFEKGLNELDQLGV